MLGLDDYGSSDEEEKADPLNDTSKGLQHVKKPAEDKKQNGRSPAETAARPDEENSQSQTLSLPSAVPASGSGADSTFAGAAEGTMGPAPRPDDSQQAGEGDPASRPVSPYSDARRLIHSLTLPPIPTVSIPPSPPGSPSPSTTSKVQQFLALKAQNVHFNDKLGSNPALRNPSMLAKLMDFAGIDEEASHASSLSDDFQVGGPAGSSFDGWAYVENLGDEIKKRRQGQGKVEFVHSAASGNQVDANAGPVDATKRQKRSRFDSTDK